MFGRWIAAAMAALLAVSTAWAGDAEHPLKNAEPGDWAKYEVAIVDTIPGREPIDRESMTVLLEVLSINDGTASLRWTQTEPEMRPDITEIEIDLSKFQDQEPLLFMALPEMPPEFKAMIEIKKGETARETVEAADRQHDCVVAPYAIAVDFGENSASGTIREWTSPDVPVGGVVKITMTANGPEGETMEGAITLVASGDAANPPPPPPPATIGDSAIYLKQIMLGVVMYMMDNDDKFPPDLAALWGNGNGYVNDPTIFFCPVTGAPFQYVLGIKADAPDDAVLAYSEPIPTPEGPLRAFVHLGSVGLIIPEEFFEKVLTRYGPVDSGSILDSLAGADLENFEAALRRRKESGR